MIDNKELAEMLIKIAEDLKLGDANVHIVSYSAEPQYYIVSGKADISVSLRHKLADIDLHYIKKLQE